MGIQGERKMLRRTSAALSLLCLAPAVACAQKPDAAPPALTLFENVRIFDGKSDALSAPMNVLIRGNIIERISKDPVSVDRSAATTVIAGGGRTLMPGLIDAHWHAMLIRPDPAQAIVGDIGFNNLAAGAEATATLMRGFTSVRDV